MDGWTKPPGTAALIFDCDGTLADTMPAHLVAWQATTAALGISFPEERFYALAGVPALAIIDLLAGEQGVPMSAVEMAAAVIDKETRYVAGVHLVRPIDAVVAVAEQHRGILPMAVASGGERWVVIRTLETVGVLGWFDAVLGAEDTEAPKPAPDVFLAAAQRLAVHPAHCVVFEDSDLGLEGARRAGMLGVDVRVWR